MSGSPAAGPGVGVGVGTAARTAEVGALGAPPQPDASDGIVDRTATRKALGFIMPIRPAVRERRVAFGGSFGKDRVKMTASDERVRVLLIDDDRALADLVGDYLRPLGYDVDWEADGRGGLDRALRGGYAAVVLDVRLPGMNGIDVLRALREKSTVPVIMLSALGDEPDRVAGLEMGADDYLPKTASPRELLARLRSVVRRSALARASGEERHRTYAVNGLFVDPGTRTVSLDQRAIELTRAEFDVLLCLARSPGRVRTRDELLAGMSDRAFEAFDRSVDVHVSSLRRKLADDPRSPRFIETVRGIGYRIRSPASSS
jgi:two-component system response regulator CpxR